MSQLHNEPQIRIIRKKSRHGGHHGGAWKVAYADFVTAMMALFIVLWIVGQSKEVKEYIAYYFKDPGVFSETTRGAGVLMGGSMHAPQPAKKLVTREEEQERLTSMGDSILASLRDNPSASLLLDQIEIQIVREGLRIEMVESSQNYFFDVGTSTIKPQAKEVLATIAEQVSHLPNHVIVEGHTDSRKYSTFEGYSNFELSADRANSARRVLSTSGVRQDQFAEVRGYADSQLKNPEDPLDASNRRISIIIQFESE